MNGTDWIQTFTGKKFFPLKPNIKDICIEDIAHSLSMQCRFNGHSNQFYSVAQHCCAMVNCFFNSKEDRELAKYALLHDAGEAYLSDIPSPIKRLPEFQFYREAESNLSRVIYLRFGLQPFEPEQVKQADWQLLCEEAMSPKIMSPLHPDWIGRCEPVIGFTPVPPERAEQIFLDKFHSLFDN